MTTRPCWSADPPDALVTATAPLCNQGIYSCFYPASASFFLAVRPTQNPASLPHQHPPFWWARRVGLWGLQQGGEWDDEPLGVAPVSTQTPGVSFLASPPPILGTHFQRSRRTRGELSGVLCVASHFIHPRGRQSCA